MQIHNVRSSKYTVILDLKLYIVYGHILKMGHNGFLDTREVSELAMYENSD